jgi:hypothetical protein
MITHIQRSVLRRVICDCLQALLRGVSDVNNLLVPDDYYTLVRDFDVLEVPPPTPITSRNENDDELFLGKTDYNAMTNAAVDENNIDVNSATIAADVIEFTPVLETFMSLIASSILTEPSIRDEIVEGQTMMMIKTALCGPLLFYCKYEVLRFHCFMSGGGSGEEGVMGVEGGAILNNAIPHVVSQRPLALFLSRTSRTLGRIDHTIHDELGQAHVKKCLAIYNVLVLGGRIPDNCEVHNDVVFAKCIARDNVFNSYLAPVLFKHLFANRDRVVYVIFTSWLRWGNQNRSIMAIVLCAMEINPNIHFVSGEEYQLSIHDVALAIHNHASELKRIRSLIPHIRASAFFAESLSVDPDQLKINEWAEKLIEKWKNDEKSFPSRFDDGRKIGKRELCDGVEDDFQDWWKKSREKMDEGSASAFQCATDMMAIAEEIVFSNDSYMRKVSLFYIRDSGDDDVCYVGLSQLSLRQVAYCEATRVFIGTSDTVVIMHARGARRGEYNEEMNRCIAWMFCKNVEAVYINESNRVSKWEADVDLLLAVGDATNTPIYFANHVNLSTMEVARMETFE